MASDLFQALDRLFNKMPMERPPSMYVINRFLSWRPELAPLAASVSKLSDDQMAWSVWQSILPRQPNAPRLGYPAPKRTPAAEDLVSAVLSAHPHMPRDEAEAAVDIAEATNNLDDMLMTYGVEAE